MKNQISLDTTQKVCMLVLGMHRSGTSATAGSLYKLGFYTGDTIPGIKGENDKGFFENIKISHVNRYILEANFTSWDTNQKFNFSSLSSDKVNIYKEEIKKAINDEFKTSKGLIVIKDPRICLLLPLYKEVLAEMEYQCKVTFIYRNPTQVYLSLKKRDDFTVDKAYGIIANYILQAELHSRDMDRIFISYETLLKDPKVLINRIQSKLNIAVSNDSGPVSEFLESSLQHHTKKDIIREGDYKTIETIYSILKEQVSGSNNKLSSTMDQLSNAFYKKNAIQVESGLLANAEIADLEKNKNQEMIAELKKKQSTLIREFDNDRMTLESTIDGLKTQLFSTMSNSDHTINSLNTDVKSLKTSIETQNIKYQQQEHANQKRVDELKGTIEDLTRQKQNVSLDLRKINNAFTSLKKQSEIDQLKIAELQALQSSQVNEIKSLNNNKNALNGRIKSLNEHAGNLRLEADDRTLLVENVRASFSYKVGRMVTFPVRFIYDIFKS